MVIGCRARQHWRTSILICIVICLQRSVLCALCHLEVTGKKKDLNAFLNVGQERSVLCALCHLEVTGKKRSERVFKRWSSEHNWQERVATNTQLTRFVVQGPRASQCLTLSENF